jgi:hypothetical protein
VSRARRGGIAALLLLALPACGRRPALDAKVQPDIVYPDTAARSAAEFTQAFYDWYRGRNLPMDSVTGERPELLEPTLLQALKADFAAQAGNSEDIVGLDWDPFIGSQDPCDPYTVAGATRSGDTVNVPVRGQCPDAAPRSGPDVIAQLRRSATGWVFVDFRHADDKGGLRQDLAELKAERDSGSRRRTR